MAGFKRTHTRTIGADIYNAEAEDEWTIILDNEQAVEGRVEKVKDGVGEGEKEVRFVSEDGILYCVYGGENDDGFYAYAVKEDGTRYDIDTLYDWGAVPSDAPDKTVSELAEENDISREKVVEERAVDEVTEAIAELEHIRMLMKQLLDDEITFHQYMEELSRMEARKGGTLAVEGF